MVGVWEGERTDVEGLWTTSALCKCGREDCAAAVFNGSSAVGTNLHNLFPLWTNGMDPAELQGIVSIGNTLYVQPTILS